MKKFKKIGYILVGIIVVLWILNPSYKHFEEFSNGYTDTRRKIICKRVFQGIVYSVYERQVVTMTMTTKEAREYGYDEPQYEYSPPERYYGFCLNFYK